MDVMCSAMYSETNEMGGACSMYGKEERRFGLVNLRERDHLVDSGVGGRIILRWIFRRWDMVVWTGTSCFGIGTDGGHL